MILRLSQISGLAMNGQQRLGVKLGFRIWIFIADFGRFLERLSHGKSKSKTKSINKASGWWL
jgi:hypothetical protein